MRIHNRDRVAQRVHGEHGAGLKVESDSVGINADLDGLRLAGVRIKGGNLVGLRGSRVKERRRNGWIENDTGQRLNAKERGRTLFERCATADVDGVKHAVGLSGSIQLERRDDSEAAAIRTAIRINGDGDGTLIHGCGGRSERADGAGGKRSEVDGGNGVRNGVGNDGEIRFLVNGHAAGSGTDGDGDGFS